tara:strand:- start:6400 stop:6726 length:327 start_codon:yes stop_codon:yes gene_type:complete
MEYDITLADWYGSSYKEGTLVDVSAEDIEAVLGEANSEDDPDKVDKAWRFVVKVQPTSYGLQESKPPVFYDTFCNIWDWYGSGDKNEWSFYGSSVIMKSLFGENHVKV